MSCPSWLMRCWAPTARCGTWLPCRWSPSTGAAMARCMTRSATVRSASPGCGGGRLGPDDDDIAVTAAQVRDVITRLADAGHWREGDQPVLVIFDAGYDLTRLAWLLADLPVQVLGRLRSDRVMQLSAPPRQPGTRGRPRKHGGELALADPATWPSPQVTTTTATSRYGTAVTGAWDRVHARLTHRAAWLDHDGPLPVIEGTLIRLQAGHLPGDRDPKPVWLWWSATGALPADVDRCWQSFLRRFDLET